MNYRAIVSEVIHSLADFLFPSVCLLCGGTIPGENILCRDCKEAVSECSHKFNPPQRRIDNVDVVSVLLPYDTHCRTLIHSLKYHGRSSIGLFLGNLMGKKAVKNGSHPQNTLIVPVPLHPLKLKERGYNQSERLACGFASFTGHTVDETILERIRNTDTQTALDGELRNLNVQGAFRYSGRESLKGCPVIIIDDVMTTGSTISECARALREGGAGTVTVCVAATPEPGTE